MRILTFFLVPCFVVAFVNYYRLAFKIRDERVGDHPSLYRLLSNPLFVRKGDLTEHGRRLHNQLLITLAFITLFGCAIVIANLFGAPLP
jgi:hypothetical protein